MSLPRTNSSALTHATTPEQIAHEHIAKAFIVLQLIGGSGLTIVVLTAAFGRGVKRYSTWYSFCGSWIFSCISYTLLAFAGQMTGPTPDYALCVVQSALIYAAPALTACTTLALIIHMLLNVRRLLRNAPFKTDSSAILALVSVPYVVWLVIFVAVFVYGISNVESVRRSPNDTYCDSTNPLMSKISSLIVLSSTTLIMALQGVIATRLYQNRKKITGSITMVARVMVFSLLGALALGLAVAYVLTWKHGQAFDMILASLPVLAFLIFGTQLDLIRIWTCRGNRTPTAAEKPLLLHSQYASVSTEDSI